MNDSLTVQEAQRLLKLGPQDFRLLVNSEVIPTWKSSERHYYSRARLTEFAAEMREPDGKNRLPGTRDGVPQSPGALIAQLVDGGGWLLVVEPPIVVRALWRRLLHAARSDRSILPAGKVLKNTGRDSGHLVIWLDDAPPPSPTPCRSRTSCRGLSIRCLSHSGVGFAATRTAR